jgi:hypothetical protein
MLVATVSADRANCEETISTLKFADNAKRVMVQAVVNETRPVDHAMVQRLQDELARLKQLVVSAGLEPGATASAVMDEAGKVAAGAVVRKSLDKNDTGLADSNSQAVANMRAALNEERERGEGFKNEINNLRRALHDQKAHFEGVLGDAQAAHLQQQQQQRGANQGAISAQQAQEGGALLHTILTREVETWKQVDKMKRVLEKFFRFEVEEEVLKGKLDKFFAALSKLQDLSLGTIEHVQTGQMGGAPLHALLVASKGSEGAVAAAGGGGNDSPAAAAPVSATKKQQPELQPQTTQQQQQQQQQQQEPLFKKSAKAKPLSGAGAAAASSAIHAFGSGGGGSSYDDDDNDDADVDENGNATHRAPLLSHLSIDTKAAAAANGAGGMAITSIESAKSNRGNHEAAAPPPRQMNMPVTMQQQQQQQQQQQEVPQVQDRYEDYGSSSSFLTAVDSGLPHIRSSLDGGLPRQQQQQQQQQQQRASADSFAGFKKPSPKAAYAGAKAVPARSLAGGSKQQQQQQQQQSVAMGRERGGQRVPMPPQQQQLMQPRQMNVPVTMQQQFQGQQQQQQLQQAGAGSVASRTVNRQASAGSLHQTGQQQHGHGAKGMSSRENSRVRLEAAAIIDDTPDEEEEEAQLRKELAKAQKKLKKQQQLQEWIREKENRALAAQASEDQVKRAQEQEELQKERKRKEYAKKQKEKLQGYKHKITQEAQKIQELVDLGIDPNSLF